MKRFDYLRDAPPDFVDRIRAYRLPRRLRSAAWALAVLACVLCGAAGIESMRVHAALALERRAAGRIDAQRLALARARLQWRDVDRLMAADRRLRRIRLSGSAIAARLVKIANVLPRRVWLSSIGPSAAGWAVQGEAIDVPALDTALENLVASTGLGSPQLVRMATQARLAATPVVTFELTLAGPP